MSTPQAKDWFYRWLPWHKRLNPHKGWPEYEAVENRNELYAGWILAFDRHGITAAAAATISRLMQARPPEWPEHHLAAITSLAPEVTRQIREEAESRRRLLERDQVDQLHREREARRQQWRQLPKSERAQIQAEVEREYPLLVPFTKWIEILCYEELARRHAPAPVKTQLTELQTA